MIMDSILNTNLIRDNNIKREGAEAIVESISKLSKLTSLDLNFK